MDYDYRRSLVKYFWDSEKTKTVWLLLHPTTGELLGYTKGGSREIAEALGARHPTGAIVLKGEF